MIGLARILFAFTALVVALYSPPSHAATTAPTYPATPRGDVIDSYFGTTVADPYRWMEDVDSPQTAQWVKAEGELTRSYLDAIPQRAAIAAAYRKLYDYEKVNPPFRAGKHWFYFRNSGLQTQSVLYIRDSETGPARSFFDPNALSKDGTVQLGRVSFTYDGTLMAYSTQTGGSDWLTWHVKSVVTGKDEPDVLYWSKYSFPTWLGDTGFYYRGYDAPNAANQTLAPLGALKLRFHRLGTPQSSDRLVYAAKGSELAGIRIMDDQRYSFFQLTAVNGNSLAWKYRSEADTSFRAVFPLQDNVQYSILGNDGSRVYIKTNLNAPRNRVGWLDLTDQAHVLHDIVPEGADKIDQVLLVGNNFYVARLHDAHSVLSVVDLHGRLVKTIALPFIGTAYLGGRRNDPAVYYTFESWAYPLAIFRYAPTTAKSTLVFRSAIAFDPKPYVTEQIFTTSNDGTRVPVFVVHRRDMPLNGSTPTILSGYGGFNISWNPYFYQANAMWLEMGGAYAVAILRGGGEYGETWHEAGMLANKQRVFDDFIAAAQMLIDRKITSKPKLAVNGGSNGGLLVGAVVTQRPDLFGAVIAEEGVFDMLRYQKFTIGKFWIPEYGSAEASEQQFKTLYAYSPLNNVKDGTRYPPTLIATADHDDRVHPSHSFKFAAALQHAQADGAPILLRVETNEGHFAGLTTDKAIAMTADFYAFLAKSLEFNPRL
jgi:prolyl oligopeptidase